jgi:hypothetical protein
MRFNLKVIEFALLGTTIYTNSLKLVIPLYTHIITLKVCYFGYCCCCNHCPFRIITILCLQLVTTFV